MTEPGFRHPPLAAWHRDRPHQRYALGRFRLESGEAIEDCVLTFVTHGTLARDGGNAVLVCPAIGQSHHRLDFLIGEGKALDPARDFIIAVDALGNGLASSPSNSARQPGTAFPRFTIGDMVASQHRLLSQAFALDRLKLVIGASMGGMQALEWAVAYPAMMQQVVAMTPMARTTPWSVLVNAACRAALMADPAWDGTRFTAAPERGWRAWAGILRGLANRTPEAVAQDCPTREAVLAWFEGLAPEMVASGPDPLDWIYQSHAYDAHDVARRHGGDLATALARVRARCQVIAAPVDLYNPATAAREAASLIPGARFLEVPSIQGHQAANWLDPADAAFLNREIAAFRAAA